MSEYILEVKQLKKHFLAERTFLGRKKKYLKAVNDVSFSVRKGETFGLVGESGCGKSTIGKVLIGLHEPTAGQIIFDGKIMNGNKKGSQKSLRDGMQIIFQDPFGSLNPNMTVREIIEEPLRAGGFEKSTYESTVLSTLKKVGLHESDSGRYPSEFSGGQRQRIAIARALVVNPKFIICDEPTSALDVSIQAQVVNTLGDLQRELGLTYLFISHDLSMVRYVSDRVGVMYLGKIVEVAPADVLYENPKHPYTKALLASIPIPDPEQAKNRGLDLLVGDVPSPLEIPKGCSFRKRCPSAGAECEKVEPELRQMGKEHYVSCHLYKDVF